MTTTTLDPRHLPSRYIHAVRLPGPDTTAEVCETAELLCCRVWRGAPTLFFLTTAELNHPSHRRRFVVVPAIVQGLRGDLTARNYIATIQQGATDCLHVLEVPLLGEPMVEGPLVVPATRMPDA